MNDNPAIVDLRAEAKEIRAGMSDLRGVLLGYADKYEI
jgi:hypothetical protein